MIGGPERILLLHTDQEWIQSAQGEGSCTSQQNLSWTRCTEGLATQRPEAKGLPLFLAEQVAVCEIWAPSGGAHNGLVPRFLLNLCDWWMYPSHKMLLHIAQGPAQGLNSE